MPPDFSLKLLALLSTAFLVPSAAFAKKIGSVKISGNANFSTDAIKAKVNVKAGDAFKEEQISSSIKSLYSTGWFENISTEFENGVLTYKVTEVPRVLSVKYVGNSLIKDDMLKKYCILERGALASPYLLARDLETIKSLYRSMGRSVVDIDVKQEVASPGRINLELHIKEGPRVFIRDVQFFGNASIPDSLLASRMLTRAKPFYRILGHNAYYNPQAFALDESIIRDIYKSMGFLSCKVAQPSAELSSKLNALSVKIVIEEGEQYQLGEIQIKNETETVPTSLISRYIRRKFGFKLGTCDLKKIREAESDLEKKLSSLGYRDVDLSYEIRAPERNRVTLTFFLKDKKPILVKKITIKGAKKATTDLIKRHLYLEEGQTYSKSQQDKSIAQLRSLGIFQDVSIDPKIDQESRYADILVKLSEKKTGHMSLNWSLDTMQGAGFRFDLSERNILGQNYKFLSEVSLKFSKRRVGAEIGGDLNKNSGVSVFGACTYYPPSHKPSAKKTPQSEDSDIDEQIMQALKQGDKGKLERLVSRSKGNPGSTVAEHIMQGQTPQSKDNLHSKFGVGLTNAISTNFKHQITDSINYQKVGEDPVKETQSITGGRIRDLTSGKFVYNKLKNSLLWALEKRDNERHLSLGSSCSHAYHTDIGSDYSFHKFSATAKARIPLRKLEELYLVLRADLGMITQFGQGTPLRHQNCFTLGGEGSLRGFDRYGCDAFVVDKGRILSIGGDRYYRAVGELHTNMGLPDTIPVSFFGFLDLGSIWRTNLKGCSEKAKSSDDIRFSSGIGITIIQGGGRMKITRALVTKASPGDSKDPLNVELSIDF